MLSFVLWFEEELLDINLKSQDVRAAQTQLRSTEYTRSKEPFEVHDSFLIVA